MVHFLHFYIFRHTFQVASVISSTVLGLSSTANASLKASQDTLVMFNYNFLINTSTTSTIITCFPSNFSVSKRLDHSNLCRHFVVDTADKLYKYANHTQNGFCLQNQWISLVTHFIENVSFKMTENRSFQFLYVWFELWLRPLGIWAWAFALHPWLAKLVSKKQK